MLLERGEVSTLDVLDRVLDKGVIVDYGGRVSLLGVDLLTIIEGRAVVASIDTHLRYAEPIRKSGLTPAYPKGALHQALTPLPPRAHPPKFKPAYDGPAPYFAEPDLPLVKAHDGILNPFSVYQKGERRLRDQLSALSVWHLANIAEAYELVDQGVDPTLFSQPELVELIVSTIKRRKGRGLRGNEGMRRQSGGPGIRGSEDALRTSQGFSARRPRSRAR
jgi:hypothetical protein